MATKKIHRKKDGAKVTIAKFTKKYGNMSDMVNMLERDPASPAKWRPDYTRMIFWLALSGMPEEMMANVMGVQYVTFSLWKRNHPDFMAALQAGKHESVAVASNALYQVGIGMQREAVKIIPNRVKTYDPHTGKVIKEETKIIREKYTINDAPNVQALSKFLAARFPEVWGNKQEVLHTGTVSHKLDPAKLTKKQLKMIKKLRKSTESDGNS